uniref:G-protein coupled receptors family 3 profile domain-containing protein n=1 Tax=Lates calcarifer TaxID=8187 RepID=A0A4W6C7N1_LATCA
MPNMALWAAKLIMFLSLFRGTLGSAALDSCVFLGEEEKNSLYEDGDVVIGGLFPLHYSPESSLPTYKTKPTLTIFKSRALRWIQTMTFAIKEINQRSDLLPQLKLGYHIRDSCDDIPVALRELLLLVNGQPERGLLDCLSTFVVSYFASCSCLSDQREFPTFMRTMPSDAFQIRALVQLVTYFGWTWVGVIGVDSDYARFAIQLFLQESVQYGVCAAYTHLYPVTLSQQALDKLLECYSGTSVIINFCSESEMQGILTEIRRRNITGLQWIASEAWATATLLWEKFGNLLTGTLGFAIQRADVIPGLEEHLTSVRPSDIHKSTFLAEFWEETFNCRLNGLPCKGTESLDDVYSPYSDVTQLRVSYNIYKAVYLVAHALQDMSDCKGGKGPFSNGTCADPKHFKPWQVRLVLAVLQVPVLPGERGNPSAVLTCTRCSEDTWPNRARDLCIPKTIEYLSYHELMGIMLCVVSVLGACISLSILAIFFMYKDTPLVRANNMELSFLLLVFLAVCFLVGLLFIGEPSDWLCRIRYPTFGISVALCISCLLAKTAVVLMAFRSTLPGSNMMKWFGPNQQRASVLFGTAVQVIICLIWLLTSPPHANSNTDYHSATIIMECVTGSEVCFWCVLGYIGILACMCFLMAFLARKLPDNFNEAKFITFSMLIFFAVWITFIPVYVSTAGKYTVAVHIFAILASAFGLLFCIFAPKCYIIILKPEKNSKKHMMQR